MASPHATLTQLAHQAAAQIGFTACRWWRDAEDPSVLRVEVERRLVGARPAIAQLTAAIPFSPTPRSSPSASAPPPPRSGSMTRTQRQPPGKRGMARRRNS